MKTIIYAGIGLFTVATIYGATDFYQSNKKGVLINLYNEKSTSAQQVVSKENEKPTIKMEDYSRAILETELDKEALSSEALLIENKKISSVVSRKKVNKRKVPKIKFSDFSRSKLVISEALPLAVTDSSIEKY